MVQNITIICDSMIVDEAKRLLSISRASSYPSIVLKSKSKTQSVDISEVEDVAS